MRQKRGSDAFTGTLTNENGTRQYYVTKDGKQGVRSPMSPTRKRDDGQIDSFMRQSTANKMYDLLRMGVRKGHFLDDFWQEQIIWVGRHEKKKERLYDRFKRRNISKDMMALAVTPDEYRQGGMVVGTTWVSWGTLPMVGVTDGVSDIYLGDLEIGAHTTIGELSRAIVAHNVGWVMGDMLSFIVVRQEMRGELPTAKAGFVQFYLSAEETRCVWTYGSIGWGSKNGYLALNDDSFRGGYCWVHGGWRENKWQVSEQRLMVERNQELITRYTSDEQWQKAADGYRAQGEERDKLKDTQTAVVQGNNAISIDMDAMRDMIREAVKEGVMEALREVMKEKDWKPSCE